MKTSLGKHFPSFVAALLATTPFATSALSKWIRHDRLEPGCTHVIVPQARGFALDPATDEVQVESVHASVEIVAAVATTTLDISLSNLSSSDSEAVLFLPVPDGAAVHGFAFDGAAPSVTAELLPRERAKTAYDAIVDRIQDPALLEFAGHELVRTSLFPVPAVGTQRVRLTYSEVLRGDGNRLDYVLPRSESLSARAPWKVEIQVRGARPVACLYSPSHELETTHRSRGRLRARTSAKSAGEPGSFRLHVLFGGDDLSASLLACPDADSADAEAGWFLLLAGLAAPNDGDAQCVARDVTLVLDRSGSMSGEKLEQAQRAAVQVIGGLGAHESFRVLDYSDGVRSLSHHSLSADLIHKREAQQYLKAMVAHGGTNLHDALLEALRADPRRDSLPIVLFLTDGLATVGQTSESAIREMVEAYNVHQKRVFTLGVGHDVNVPLLDRVASTTRATSTYVLPGEDVELKTAEVFERLHGPVLADLELRVVDEHGRTAPHGVQDVLPAPLPDLFEGDRLVLLGRYTGPGPLRFRLSGRHDGRPRTFAFDFDGPRASTRNTFVPRLWASRRIAELVDRIRTATADVASSNRPQPAHPVDPMQDPYLRELAQVVLALSTRFGVLSEYTAFLAREGTDLADWSGLERQCREELDGLAVEVRSGRAAVNQGLNLGAMRQQECANMSNRMWTEAEHQVEASGVQQVADRALYLRGQRWIDANLVTQGRGLEADEVIDLGSPAHVALMGELAKRGQQGVLALDGEVLFEHDGRRILVRNRVTRVPVERPARGTDSYR